MSKKYYINVWECLFYKVDEQGNELRDDNGNIILYEAPKLDYSSNTEFIEDDDLIESKFKWEETSKDELLPEPTDECMEKEPEKPKTIEEHFDQCLRKWGGNGQR